MRARASAGNRHGHWDVMTYDQIPAVTRSGEDEFSWLADRSSGSRRQKCSNALPRETRQRRKYSVCFQVEEWLLTASSGTRHRASVHRQSCSQLFFNSSSGEEACKAKTEKRSPSTEAPLWNYDSTLFYFAQQSVSLQFLCWITIITVWIEYLGYIIVWSVK